MSISSEVLNKIKEENIKQKPKWVFLLIDYSTWIMIASVVVLSGIAFGLTNVVLEESDLDLASKFHRSFLDHFLRSIPLLFVILLIILGIITYIGLRHTRYGYRYSNYKLVALICTSIVVFGTSIYVTGAARQLDETLVNSVDTYADAIKEPYYNMWMQPEYGVIAGEIIEEKGMENIIVIDMGKKIWLVDVSNLKPGSRIYIKEGKIVKVIGIQTGTETFSADELRVWRIPRELFGE